MLGIGHMTISDKLRIRDNAFEIGEMQAGEQVVLKYEAVIPEDLKEKELYFIYAASSWDFEANEPFAQKGGLELITIAEEVPDLDEEDKQKEEELKKQEELKRQQEEAKKAAEVKKKSTTPHTGDEMNTTTFILCMLLAIAVVVSIRKKNTNNHI